MFPYLLIFVVILAWVIFLDFLSPKIETVAPPRTWGDATPADRDWLDLFLKGCESPAEEKFLQAMVNEFDFYPDKGVLISPRLSMEMQCKFQNYRFDFVLNGKYIVEIDGATYHSSPEQVERDRIRDEFSIANGYSVLRIPASVVFDDPAEAIQRVKNFALSSTALAELGAKPVLVPAPRKKAISHCLSNLTNDISIFIQAIGEESLKQAATSGFKKAIQNEQILLDAMVKKVEAEIRVLNLFPDDRKFHHDMYEKITQGHVKKKLSETFPWAPVVLPTPIGHDEVQRKIEAECAQILESREKRFGDLRARLGNDFMFALLFHRYMRESGFPQMDIIHSLGHSGTKLGWPLNRSKPNQNS